MFLAGLFVSVLEGQVPLIGEQGNGLEVAERLVFDWKVDAAESMLRSGLVDLAEDLYRELLAVPGLGAGKVADLQLQLAKALIAQRQFMTARTVLEEIPVDERRSTYYLYLAISVYGNGHEVDTALLANSLSQVVEAELPGEDIAWFHLLTGFLAEVNGQLKEVADAFEQARAAALSDVQRAFLDALILREELRIAPVDESLIRNTENRLRRFSGTAAAYPFVRQYAVILNNQGRAEEAIEIINQELAAANSGYENQQREQLLLLKGVLYGVDTLSGRDTLRTLVREGKNREVVATALQLLVQAGNSSEQAELSDFLNTMIARAEPHPLLGQLYYLRSQLALARGDIAKAEADARLLLEQFPGLNRITSVYRLLAYAALQRNPPQYRAAADFLIQMRDQSEASGDRLALNQLIGDCYFLNGDYRNALDFYQSARGKDANPDGNSELFLRIVTAATRSGQIETATQYIDKADSDKDVSVADRWRAEWNVSQALQANGELEIASARVRSLLSDSTTSSVPTALDLRLHWLELRLSMLLGESEEVQPRMNALLSRIESIPEEKIEPLEVELLRTEVLLLKADLLIKIGESTSGIQLLELLRTDFAESSAAERSYLTEANYYASIDDFKAAKETLLELAATYGKSPLAPQALFEAGIFCERLGADQFAEAVRIFDELIDRYPEDPLYFFARLEQGDVFRQMNDFAAAQIIYEDLIHLFPEHSHRYIAELSRAECMLALAKEDEAQQLDAALELERLLDIPNLPVDFQVEVGFKWGFALQQGGKREESKSVYALISSRFLLEDENRLGATGRYWMSRILLELGTSLEEGGELAEARRVYRKIVAYNLPGRNLAQSRANRILVVEE